MFRTHRRRPSVPHPIQLHIEALEDRCLLSGNVLQTNLVSDLPGVAQHLDPNLVNPWGISESSTSPFWLSDNNSGHSTLYDTTGTPQALVVSIPTPGDPAGNSGAPTGTVFNTTLASKTPGFTVSDGTHSGPAIFLFATEDGTILGWNPTVDPTGQFNGPNHASTHAVLAVDHSGNNFSEPDPLKQTGAVYKGLTIATDSHGQTLLYVTNFRAGTVEVYDTNFKPVKLPPGAFTDPNLPKGYAPFNIQELGGKIYVTYALQNAAKHDDVAGAGHGFVDVYNLDGSPGRTVHGVKQERLISSGRLDSPWGLALAPSSFGNLAGKLLVGNFGDGRIHVYDPASGDFLATLKDPDGEPIQINGLWALKVGNGAQGGDKNTVYFTAGIDDEKHGLFGSLKPVARGTPEGPAEAQTLQIAVDVFQLNLTTVLQDLSSGVTGATLQQDIQTLDNSLVQLIQAGRRFAADAFRDGQGPDSSGSEGMDRDALDHIFAQLGDF